MTEQTLFDRVLPGLFDELADARTPDYLEAAIERASSQPQRPAWTYPGRWLPMQITTEALPTGRGLWGQLGVLALIGVLIALATVAYVGSQPARPTLTAPPLPLAANGAIALAKDGDILVADRPGGDTRPLVAGPELDEQPMFSPDGTTLAFLRLIDVQGGWALMVADADGTNVVQITPEPLDLGLWSFAPDGRSLIAVALIDSEKRVVVRPVDPAAAPTVLDVRLPDAWMDVEAPSFRPTNPQEILVVAQLDPVGPRGIYVYDLATDGIRTIVEPAAPHYVQDVAWSPTGEHISYDLWDGTSRRSRVVAADGSGDRALDAAPGTASDDRVSPWSNDGTRMVLTRDPGGEAGGQTVVVSASGDGEPIELACGPTTDIECAPSWIWSPDDSMLIGTTYDETSSSGETTLTASYQLADPDTGQVTELDWDGGGPPAWQRVAP
jgi:Tol biopolymer transport system component